MKKALRIIGKIILVIVGVHLAAFLFFWIKNKAYIGGTEDSLIEYLNQHKQDISDPESAINLFDEDFYSNQLFLLGENHGAADVQQVDKQLFIHLHEKLGLRYYVAEMDSIRARRLNSFLSSPTKDAATLKQVVADIALRIPQQSSQGLYEKWMNFYDYNQRQPDSMQMIVLGIDKDFEDTSQGIGRDSIMLLNFKKIVEDRQLEDELFYGLFGYTHVLQDRVMGGGFTPLAAKIKKSDLPCADAVASIVCYNIDSEVRLPATGQYPAPPDEKTTLLNVDGPFVLVKGIKDLEEATEENTITLFDLDAPASPYTATQRLAGVKVNLMGSDVLPTDESQSTTDLFQYVVLIRNSKALTGLKR
uniref:Uncharacterized protein n=1 Tax=Roseihalotalea indica TaxID=2867963 RepID=A0AA49JFM2_9BACT|nr:hypothetical protein K4G66_22820 [Tunicatimonas sp. TK19036]